ncbi:MAG: type III pantothenate kinase [Clostridia bacterium]|jgi:type III pantothenate kinase|nr:type III pantothenate kinase [Clostridia bacterium]
MLLVIDIGNTNIKMAVFQNDEIVMSLRLATVVGKTSDEYGLNVKDLLQSGGIDLSDITAVIMSSVNPNLNYTFEHMVQYYFKVKPMLVGAGIKTGLSVKYNDPKEVGSDRIVNSVAAYHTYGGPVIVIDCGTATTFNVIGEKGEFLGGLISFGLKTSADALSGCTAKLPKIELTAPPTVVCKSTITNMQSGIINGFIGMVEHIVRKIKEETGFAAAKVVATGGLSELIGKNSSVIDVFDRTLTLRGLNIIYKLNK